MNIINTISGHCGKCGAPYYMPQMWHGIFPPTPQPSCNCWNTPETVTVTECTISNKNIIKECKTKKYCEWEYEYNESYFITGCGKTSFMDKDGHNEDLYIFCPFCGKKIKEQ